MQAQWRVILAVALAAWPVGVVAQGAPRAPRPPRPPRPARAPAAFAFSWSDNRGRIGVVVRTDADAESDKLGAKIEGVTPEGPAAKAGLKVGDVITKFNGTDLAGVKAEAEEESGPGTKLIALARKLEPGDTVQVEYRRGGDTKKAALVAEDLGESGGMAMPMPRMELRQGDREPFTVMAMPRIAGRTAFCFGADAWCAVEFVSLNPDLGEYFGAKEGILVVKAPGDSSLPLRSGDVILAIGGRKPTSPSHAMRILQSYEQGETVAIELMRKQKRTSVTWKVPVPGREDRLLRGHEDREEPSGFRLFRPQVRHLQRA
ncbi:MAG TPA: PDZ domain-containing protein [Gemmatimonadales bacterium]|jgi:S1-C subfamily serine protease|nr:PDZ domain-containing protein [Gemmatimonadales bacterium]